MFSRTTLYRLPPGPDGKPYRYGEVLRLYRSLLKNAYRYPLASRREVVTEEVQAEFRNPAHEKLTRSDLDYKLTLGWERNATIAQYAANMHWFHSRDVVDKNMLRYSQQRDKERVQEVERCNEVGDAHKKTEDVTKFKSVMYNVNPNYFHKVDSTPLNHDQDLWRCRGQYGSDSGGPRQKFFIKRYKPIFPQGW